MSKGHVARRTSCLVGPDCKVCRAYDAATHAQQVLVDVAVLAKP